MFSRLLFFAQILRFQGPMVEVIFSMTGELLKFGVVMLVVMLGFAMSFYALFSNVDTFDDTWLVLFKAMLGEVGLFDEFDDPEKDRYKLVATVMLVAYLVVMSIMLLNLLIAVLSTSHAKVQENADLEFKVSTARLVQHYRYVVDEDLLPAPFNLVQLAMASPFTLVDHLGNCRTYGGIKRVVGQVVFWLVFGPLAAAGGTLVWVISTPACILRWREHFYSKHQDSQGMPASSMALRYVVICVWCFAGAPLCLIALWLTHGERSSRSTVTHRQDAEVKVHQMLKEAPGAVGASNLRKYLEDPMSDPKVRQDETKRGTTVEHIKLLRDRLEETTRDRVEHLAATAKDHANELHAVVRKLTEECADSKTMIAEQRIELTRALMEQQRMISEQRDEFNRALMEQQKMICEQHNALKLELKGIARTIGRDQESDHR